MFKQCQQHLCRFSLSSLPRSPGTSAPLLYISVSLCLSLSLSFFLVPFHSCSPLIPSFILSFSLLPLSVSFSHIFSNCVLSLSRQVSILMQSSRSLAFLLVSFSFAPVKNIPSAFLALLPPTYRPLSLFLFLSLGVMCICVTTIIP